MPIISSANGNATLNGTNNADIIVIEDALIDGAPVVNAGDGNDVIFGVGNSVFLTSSFGNNASFGSALNIDNSARWSTQVNPLIGNDVIPHTTVVALGDGEFDFYSVTVGAGQTLIADTDFGNGIVSATPGGVLEVVQLGGPDIDSILRVFDENQNQLAFNDDAEEDDFEGLGSSNEIGTLDSFLSWQNTSNSAVTVFLQVQEFDFDSNLPESDPNFGAPIEAGGTYVLNVSVTGHANSGNAIQGDDSINGAAGRDFIIGNEGDDTLFGGAAQDTIHAGAGDDFIVGGEGNDVVFAGPGNDVIRDGDGDDFYELGEGFNTVFLNLGTDTVVGGDIADTVQISIPSALSAGDVLDGGAFIDVLQIAPSAVEVLDFSQTTLVNWEEFLFSPFGVDATVILTAQQAAQFTDGFRVDERSIDISLSIEIVADGASVVDLSLMNFNSFISTDSISFSGGSGAERFVGASVVANTLFGAGGADVLQGGVSNDMLDGGEGGDTLDGLGGDDTLFGGNGSDVIGAGLGFDLVFGGNGADTINSGNGFDTVFGGNGQDSVSLGNGNDLFTDNLQGSAFGADTVFAGNGDDTIEGGAGADSFFGGAGADVIFAGLGFDEVFGGGGADTVFAGNGNDTVTGGNGQDSVFLGDGNDVFTDNDQGGDLGADTVFAGIGDDTIEGGAGADSFFGEAGADVISAGNGFDEVFGGGGADTVFAGDGNDTVLGGNGQDEIFLGFGADTYIDTAQSGALGQDTITGGGGADTFVFGAVMSDDVIQDFEVGIDTLEFASALLDGRTAAQFVDDFAMVVDGSVVFEFGAAQSVTLQGLGSTAGLENDLDFF